MLALQDVIEKLGADFADLYKTPGVYNPQVDIKPGPVFGLNPKAMLGVASGVMPMSFWQQHFKLPNFGAGTGAPAAKPAAPAAPVPGPAPTPTQAAASVPGAVRPPARPMSASQQRGLPQWLGQLGLRRWGGQAVRQAAAPAAFGTAATQLAGRGLGWLGRAAGPLGTPVAAAMELADAGGLLPQWLGGTGLGQVGWAPGQEFTRQTSLGPAGSTLGYRGPGWQALNYAGASMNAAATPLRSAASVAASNVDLPYRVAGNLLERRRLNQLEASMAAARQQPFTAVDMNNMAKNTAGFYYDPRLGHMMPSRDYFMQGDGPTAELWRQRVRGTAGAPDWLPSQ